MSVLLPLTLWSVLTSSLVLCSAGHTSYGPDPGRQDWEESLFNGDGEEMGGAALLREWRGEEPRNGYGEETGPVPSDPHGLLEDEPSLKAVKREGHSLSIVNPLDVLRQRLMLEMARRRMKVNQEQIRENELLLKHLGKRAAPKDRTAGFRRHQVSDLEDFEV